MITILEKISQFWTKSTESYITTAESIGLEKGFKEGREEGLREGLILELREAVNLCLKLKFGIEGIILRPEIVKIHEIERLRSIKGAILITHDLEEIKKILKNQSISMGSCL